ncbi:MAG TPA: methylmalonyl Co-A mutase-associated GTPase MeaB, partial [Mycobacterium sp.]
MAADGNNTIDELAAAVRSGDRSMLARAITLVESGRPDRREQAQHLLQALMPD